MAPETDQTRVEADRVRRVVDDFAVKIQSLLEGCIAASCHIGHPEPEEGMPRSRPERAGGFDGVQARAPGHVASEGASHPGALQAPIGRRGSGSPHS